MRKKYHLQEQVRQFEVADIFRKHGTEYRKKYPLPFEHLKIMQDIVNCRTSVLGGHIEVCCECSFQQNSYNSCRNRHCPKCQTMVKERWLNDRMAELLPVSYFHNVFTLPHDLNPVILNNKSKMFDIFFAAVNETLQEFANDPQWRLVGQLGFIAILHTWNQLLLDHFHIHCLIPAGVLSAEQDRWISSRKNFLFKTGSLAKELKKRFIHKLRSLYTNKKLIFPGKTKDMEKANGFEKLIAKIESVDWVVYSKPPFGGPEDVLKYLGRYTHRVAISNNRVQSFDDGEVTFTYRDRQDNNKVKGKTIPADEFIRRFLLHVLPPNFTKIRYFGFMAHTKKNAAISVIRTLIHPGGKKPEKRDETIEEMMMRLTGMDITLCPRCKKGRMEVKSEIPSMIIHLRQYKEAVIYDP